MVSGSISLPSPGFFSPFPHGTGCTIGDKTYLALRSGLRRFTRGSTCSVLLGYLLNEHSEFSHTGLSPTAAEPSNPLLLTLNPILTPSTLNPSRNLDLREDGGSPTTPVGKPTGLGSSAFARRYLRNLFDFFSSGYLDVSVRRVPTHTPIFSR